MASAQEVKAARFGVAVVKRLIASGYSEAGALRVVNNHEADVRAMMDAGMDDCSVAIKLATYEG